MDKSRKKRRKKSDVNIMLKLTKNIRVKGLNKIRVL